MLKKSVPLCLVASCFMAASALAQVSPGTGAAGAPTGQGGAATAAPAQPPAGGMAAGGAMTGPQNANMTPLAAPQPGQMLGSDLRGTRVYGANNENIGDISDTLIDRNGQVVAVIVGVGGFLGIGQKDVAVPFQALEIVADNQTVGVGATGAGTTGTGVTGDPATTGTTATTGAADTAAGRQGTVNPNRIVLRHMTKADLENAPTFRSDATMGQTGAGGTTAPQQ